MNQVKEYVLDWDDNTLFMDTIMHFDKLTKDGTREKIEVTPLEYRDIEYLAGPDDNAIYKRIDGDPEKSYKNFRIDMEFIKDTRIALLNGLHGPAYKKIMKALKTASSWYVNTSRGHSSEGLKMGKRLIIDAETEIQDEFIRSINKKTGRSMKLVEAIEFYLGTSKDYAVNGKEFIGKYNGGKLLGSGAGKVVAMKDILRFIKNKYDSKTLVSVGFSDDNKKLLDEVSNYLVNEAKHNSDFSNMHFVTYLTENENNIIKTPLTRKQDIIDLLQREIR